MALLDVKLLGLVKLQASFDQIPVILQDRLRIFMARFGMQLRDQVKTNIVERFKSGLGPLQQGVKLQHIEEVGLITERVYIDDIPYAAIQERGGRTPAHTIEPAAANVLAFLMPGRMGFSGGPKGSGLVFAKKVNHPGANIPERSYMRLALVQMRAPFEGGIREMVNESVSESFSA